MRENTADLAPRSRALFALDFRDGAVFEPSTGLFVARSGQRGTWTRSGNTLASVTAEFLTYTAPATMPAWCAIDWDGDTVRESIGLRLGTDDRLSFPIGWTPQALSFLWEFREDGNATFAFGVMNGTNAAPYMYVANNGGSAYRMVVNNASTTDLTDLPFNSASNDRMTVRGTWYGDGSIQLWASRNGGAETTNGRTSPGTPTTQPAAWASPASVWIGMLPGLTAANRRGDLRSLIILPGERTLAELQEAW